MYRSAFSELYPLFALSVEDAFDVVAIRWWAFWHPTSHFSVLLGKVRLSAVSEAGGTGLQP